MRRALLLPLVLLAAPALAQDVRSRLIDEACPPAPGEAKGPNGVFTPREIQCRYRMGQTFEEIDTAIRERRVAAPAVAPRAPAEPRGEPARDRAQAAGEGLCPVYLAEYESGRWLLEGTESRKILLASDGGPSLELATVDALRDRIGRSPFGRSDLAVPKSREEDAILKGIVRKLRARARQADEADDLREEGPAPPALGPAPDAVAHGLACFYRRIYGEVPRN